MSQTEQVLYKYGEKQGWSDVTMLELALTYIENQNSPEAWEEFVSECAEVDHDFDIVRSEVRVHFSPEAWQRDYAIEVDAEGDTDWNVSDATAALIPVALKKGSDLDFVKGDEFAPRWVRDWTGPFTISVIEEES